MLLAGAAVCVAVFLFPERGDTEQSKVQQAVTDFALAVDRGDTAKMVALLCLDEAHGVADNDDNSADGERDSRSKPIPTTTSDVRIKGSVASVVVTRPAQKPVSVYLRKENGTWKMCAPVEKSWSQPAR
ncbi:hypothetical protein [Streptomyces sp. cg2]|uniref:Rv0361 family membrane protein n=1 Tax=Streptomyces sp. cg2 TaxID=3238799 RepID=UPI0034E202BF